MPLDDSVEPNALQMFVQKIKIQDEDGRKGKEKGGENIKPLPLRIDGGPASKYTISGLRSGLFLSFLKKWSVRRNFRNSYVALSSLCNCETKHRNGDYEYGSLRRRSIIFLI